jgi:hypothetical protein
MPNEMGREELTRWHQPNETLAKVQDAEKRAGSESERRGIRREYYRAERAQQEANGEGRKYAERRDMANNGRKDIPTGDVSDHNREETRPARRNPNRRYFIF